MTKRISLLKRTVSGVLSLALMATIIGSASLRSGTDRAAKQSTAGMESTEIAQSQPIADLQSYAGGTSTGCALAVLGLSFGLIASGIALTIATGGAGAIAVGLIVGGSYSPVGVVAC